MFELLVQFLVEIVRNVLVDALSGHLRRRVSCFWRARGNHRAQEPIDRRVHARNRERLFNKLLTGPEGDL